MAELRLGLIGYGKIAADQHGPAIAGNPDFRLAAVASRHAPPALDVPVFGDAAAMIAGTQLDAVSICTPPGPRYEIARTCLAAGLHVLMEKPPCTSLGEVAALTVQAQAAGRTLFAAWHARFSDAVRAAATVSRAEGVEKLDIRWLEDVDAWHPGQDWIWEQDGFGVFDPGINALSIATLLCPEPLRVQRAMLRMEARGQQPEAVDIAFATGGAAGGLTAAFEWRHQGVERWTIDLVTKAGTPIALSEGGAVGRIGDADEVRAQVQEYPALYAHFADLIAAGRSDVDAEPLRIVADALLRAERT